jgi:peptidoglycan hydrolase CwlO-like protein
VTDADRLDAILSRLGGIEKNSATAHAQIQGSIDVLTERVATMGEKVTIQNGRVTRAEHRLNELETKARIAELNDDDLGERNDVVAMRIWAFITGSALVGLGAVLGHFL